MDGCNKAQTKLYNTVTDYRDLKLTHKNMDVYFPLTQKVAYIQKIAPVYFNGVLLDLGCGRMPYKKLIEEKSGITQYIGMDIENPVYQQDAFKPDLFWDGKTIPLESSSVNTVILVEVLEHTPDPANILKEVNRVLATGGVVFITVPFVWNLHDVPYDEYRYTPFALERMFQQAGFSDIVIETFGNWHAAQAQFLACWVRRSYMSKSARKILSRLLLPVVKYLYKKDQVIYKDYSRKFVEGAMCTGFSVIAKKND